MKYIIVFISSLLLEIGSTQYIIAVAAKDVFDAGLWSFLCPILGILFYSEVIEAKNLRERVILAIVNGIGFLCGTLITMLWK